MQLPTGPFPLSNIISIADTFPLEPKEPIQHPPPSANGKLPLSLDATLGVGLYLAAFYSSRTIHRIDYHGMGRFLPPRPRYFR